MKKGTMKEKQTSKYKGFYTAIGISILMIGAACVYAYQVTMETNQTLENELSQTAEETQPTTNFIAEIYDAVTTTQPEYDAVAKVKTDVPVETTTEGRARIRAGRNRRSDLLPYADDSGRWRSCPAVQ